jgi:hypothetical protein
LAVQELIESNTAPAKAAALQQSAPCKDDPYAALLKSNELKKQGGLTDEELNREKRKILGS